MCTVTWFQRGRTYDLFFNRDEQRTRSTALSPRIHTDLGPPIVAPIDPDGGGTWLATNANGLTVCLLNYSGDQPPPSVPAAGMQSRGLLVLELAPLLALHQLKERLVPGRLSSFRPFMLLGIEPEHPPLIFQWDGVELRSQEHLHPRGILSTSSFQPRQVVEGRIGCFRRFLAQQSEDQAEPYRAFHAGHEPEPGPYSVCMHREDAETVSFSHVAVTSQSTRFLYVGRPPCQTNGDLPVIIPLARA